MIRRFVSNAADRAIVLPGIAIRFVLSEAITYLTEETDLTDVLLRGVDLDRIVDALDVGAVIAKVDLNALIGGLDLNRLLDGVDLDRLLASLDLNAVLDGVDLQRFVARLDLDAVLARVDVNALLDDVDISSVVRGASTTVTTEMISDVRGGSERADDAVENLVGRVLRRRVRDE